MRNPKLRRTAAPPAAEPAAAQISPEADDRTDGAVPARPPGFAAYLRYFLGLGTWGFGGPIASVGYMQRDLVERRGWLGEAGFLTRGSRPAGPPRCGSAAPPPPSSPRCRARSSRSGSSPPPCS